MTEGPLPLDPADEAIRDEAARWHLRFVEDADARQALSAPFEQWLAADPRHGRAYDDVAATWRLTRGIADAPEMLALRQQALTRLVVGRRSWHAPRAAVAAGLALLMMVGGGAWVWTQPGAGSQGELIAQAPTRLYRSRVGERLPVNLADGSTALLNTSSQLRVVYDGDERRLILDSGQAYFTVARGDRRPFRVIAADSDIVARGTAFDVRLSAGRLSVALLEGSLDVRTAAGPPVRLRPNQLLVASAGGRSVETIADPSLLTSWSQGLVVFENQTVASAAAEMSRYLARPIVVGDPSLGAARISGTFRTGESAAFLDALRHYFPIAVDESDADRVTVTLRR